MQRDLHQEIIVFRDNSCAICVTEWLSGLLLPVFTTQGKIFPDNRTTEPKIQSIWLGFNVIIVSLTWVIGSQQCSRTKETFSGALICNTWFKTTR